MRTFTKDKLTVKIADSRKEMGETAAKEISQEITRLLAHKPLINMLFAAAPSQNEVLAALVADETIAWERINAFHMDEYIGLPAGAPQTFGNFLSEHIFSKVPFHSVNYIDATACDPSAEAKRYAALLTEHPLDIVVMGIGENGHIAFNDPPVADFHDPYRVKSVQLELACRRQQVNDGCFGSLDEVPTHAITLTVPTLFAVPHLFCIVPAKSKAAAVRETLQGHIGEHCPAGILRLHEHATLYLDGDSASMLNDLTPFEG